MRRELSHSAEAQNATVDSVLPGVVGRLNSLEQAVRQNTDQMQAGKMDVDEKFEDLKEVIPQMVRDTFLGTWQTVLSGMTSMVGELRLSTAAGGGISPSAAAAVPNEHTLLPETFPNFVFHAQHNNLRSLWDEWYGLGAFNNEPVVGGVAALEETHGAKWRPKGKGNMQQRISRQGRICLGLGKKSEAEGKSVYEVCDELDVKYLECNRNLRKFVEFLQEENWIPRQQRRGRKSQDSST